MKEVTVSKEIDVSKKKRGFTTQYIRHLIQAAAFILYPGLFIMVFSAARNLLTALTGGSFSLGGLFPQLLLVSMVFLITALWGRFFCSFLCSFGMMQELIFFFSKKTVCGKVQIPRRLDHLLKYLKYGILVLITAGVWILALPVDSSWSPWGVFGMLISGNLSLVSSAIPTVGFALLLAIAVGSLFVGRFFCRYLCPLGALLAVVSGKRLYKIRRQKDSCTNCGLCTKTCSMGIPIPENEAVVSRECIQCMQCLAICPKKSLSANPSGAMAGTAAAAAIGGTVLVGNLASFPAAEPVSEQAAMKTESAEKGKYKDGVYTGTGEGFRGKIEVQVTVENGYLSDITVLSFLDDQAFFQKAQSAVIQAILTKQITDVSAVSGATFSSKGIMDAVADALRTGFDRAEAPADKNSDTVSQQPGHSNAEAEENREQSGTGDDETDATETTGHETQSPEDNDSDSSDSGQEADRTSGRFSVADGTYEGTGSGFRGTTSVSVTVKDGEIIDITIQSYKDDAAYFRRAKDTIISDIIRTQSLDVQAVSGATFSSNSILDAVADALGTGSHRAEQPADNGNGSGTGRDDTNSGNGQNPGQSETDGGNEQGAGQHGTGNGNGQGAGQSGAGGGNGQGTGQSGAGGGNGQGPEQHGTGNGSGQGPGQSGTDGGKRGNGWRGGSGGGHRVRGN